ncbi:MAG: hypothetical protein OER95_19860, partial [Acidimicrobiia bacterium]|nr:hypothetical protein [Acidimicrobiia bacterium]
MERHGQSVVPGLRFTEILDKRRNEVWHAVDSSNGQSVAAKLIVAAYEPMLPRRFPRRERALTKILGTTAGWVPVIDHGTAGDGRRFVTMPYYPAGSLADQLEHGPTPWYPSANLMLWVATTIGAAHQRGWSFGRLRPSNLLLESVDRPLISVYGSATRRFDDGTAQFTAPEVDRDGKPVPASDVFSISLILASLIAGREIDHSEAAEAIASEISNQTPRRILEVIDYGLSRRLENRYADAEKMAGALSAALEDPYVDDGVSRTDELDGDHDFAEATTVLAALLAGPLVDQGSVDQSPTAQPIAVTPGRRGHAPDEVVLHRERPAKLSDATIVRLPDPVATPPIHPTELDETDLAGVDGDKIDTDAPWPDTGPESSPWSESASGPDDPTSNPFWSDTGPLSDLIDPIPVTPSVTIEPERPCPTIDHPSNLRARQEINELIARLGVNEAAGEDADAATTDPGHSDHDPAAVGDIDPVDSRVLGPTPRPRVDLPRSAAPLSELIQILIIHRRRMASSVAVLGLAA